MKIKSKRGPGRPKGSKNKRKSPKLRSRSRRGPGRPKGSKNKRKSPKLRSRSRRRPGRPKGSKNKRKSPKLRSHSSRPKRNMSPGCKSKYSPCWKGYRRVSGTKLYSKGSCKKYSPNKYSPRRN